MNRRSFIAALCVLPGALGQDVRHEAWLHSVPKHAINVHVDTATLSAELDELRLLLLEAGDAGERVAEHVAGHLERVGLVDELEWRSDVAARGARDLSISVRIKPGSLLDRMRTALRAGDLKGYV